MSTPMSEWASVVVAATTLVGGGIGALIWLVWWLGEKFRSVEKTIYRVRDEDRLVVAAWREDHIERIYRLESKVFGAVEITSPKTARPGRGVN